jgi:hypothetical protein
MLVLQPNAGAGDFTILGFAAAQDKIIGQFFELGEILLSALDEQHGRAGIAISHLDCVLGLLDIAVDCGPKLIEFRRTGGAILKGLERLGDTRDCG